MSDLFSLCQTALDGLLSIDFYTHVCLCVILFSLFIVLLTFLRRV